MKSASSPLISLINSGTFSPWTCYTFTLLSGPVLRIAAGNFPISFSGNTWVANGVLVDPAGARPTAHWKVGLDSDQWTFTVMPRANDPISGTPWPDTIGSTPWLQALAAGALNGADVLVQRAYFPTVPVPPVAISGAVPTGMLTIFRGLVGPIAMGTTSATITIKDYKSILTQQFPLNRYWSSCRYTLYDAGCTLNRATYVKTGTVLAGSTQSLIKATPAAPGGSGTYSLGQIAMTSGLNNGFACSITSWDGVNLFKLLSPFPFAVSPGDTFNVYPGCARTQAACTLFSNLANFSGEPYIPIPETVLG